MPKSFISKIRITVTIIPFVNQMLGKISKRSGLSKSLLVEQALKQFLQKQLDQDSKSLAKINFDDLPSENEWLQVQSQLK